MPWRYQPVTVTDPAPAEPHVCLIEAYFDTAGLLKSWSEPLSCIPSGSAPDELRRDLARMLVDAHCWAAVPYESLRVGMAFPPLVTQKQRAALANAVERWGGLMDTASEPPGGE